MDPARERANRRHGIRPAEPPHLSEEERLRRASEFLETQRVSPERERARRRFDIAQEGPAVTRPHDVEAFGSASTGEAAAAVLGPRRRLPQGR